MNNIKPSTASLTSITAAITGQASDFFSLTDLEIVNTLFQHAAWSIAIIAGLVSIINGTRKWFNKKPP